MRYDIQLTDTDIKYDRAGLTPRIVPRKNRNPFHLSWEEVDVIKRKHHRLIFEVVKMMKFTSCRP